MEQTEAAVAENQRKGQDPWSFLPDFTWDSDGEPDGSGMKRLTVFPVDKRAVREYFQDRKLRQKAGLFLQDLQKYVQELVPVFRGKERGIQIEECPVRVYPQHQLLMQDYEKVVLTAHNMHYSWHFSRNTKNPYKSKEAVKRIPDIGVSWRFCYTFEAQKLFINFSRADWGSINEDSSIRGVTLQNEDDDHTHFFYIDLGTFEKFGCSKPQCAADIYVASLPQNQNVLEFLLVNHWTPAEVKNDPKWIKLTEVFHRGWISIGSESVTDDLAGQTLDGKHKITIQYTKDMLDAAGRGELEPWGSYSDSDIAPPIGSPRLFEDVKRELLRRDTVRADISACDPKTLDDPNGGSWELWEPDPEKYTMMSIPFPVYARDPRKDIVKGGLIGIDFGTKSTVVVCLESSGHIQPVRVGMGQFNRDPRESDYENPTVMEFIDLDQFLGAYDGQRGSPLTRWEDLTISHTAFEKWKNNDQTNYYFSHFGELKQWAGGADYWVRIRDKVNKEISLRPYAELRDGEFDPIEIYAYYIGLYINNMQTRKIYLKYLLSFPVTYSSNIRNRILMSFRRGLAKSLPEALWNDPKCMDEFSVKAGAGEPAAYALCALREYGFRPPEGEKIYFGIFDFGGGTTDFDFGVWQRTPQTGRRTRHKFVIRHFGDGGDRYLGGENLLELMAYHVFRDNQDVLRKAGTDDQDRTVSVPFTKPYQEELFVGYENLINDSQEARTNTRRMMEELRPLWERTEGYEEKYAPGLLKARLFTSNGGETTVELKLDKQVLEELLHKRIRKGIDEFFSALHSVFHNKFLDVRMKQVHIFLAGNASKSVILREEFDKAIHDKTEEIREVHRKKGEDEEDQEYFLLYPPLGTPEASEIMRGCGCEDSEAGLDRPTGKTGVAFGLILSREGSIYKVESEKRQDEEIKFQFYVGLEDREKDGYFQALLTPDSPYDQWTEFFDAGGSDFEFRCTTDPSANRRGVHPISETKIGSQTIPDSAVNEDWMIYLRPVTPGEIEYAVARNEEDVRSGQYQYGPVRVKLEK